jgi:hypothetical protein
MKTNAFLSYSHSDAKLAKRISRRLRRYRPPRLSKAAGRSLEIFRDEEQLTAASDLQKILEENVRKSERLVLLASPDAAASSYVELESQAFLNRWGHKAVAVVLCRGEIEEAVPPSIAGVAKKLLYIDLRKPGRRNFRLETLRLIAALFKEKYSELRREDDERRRYIRNSVLLAVLASVFLLASAYSISVTPSEGCLPVKQPVTRLVTNALAPVEIFAINRSDPSTVAWLARNARHARDLDATSAFMWRLDREPEGFARRVKKSLANLAGSPAVTLELTFENNGEPGELIVQIFAFRRNGKYISFARKGFIKFPPGQRTSIPFTEKAYEPFYLEPEIAQVLSKLGLDRTVIRGTLTDHTDGNNKHQVEFWREDTRDDMREVLDAVSSPEYDLFSNNPTWSERFGTEMESWGARAAWESLVVKSADWLRHEPPESQEITLDAHDLGPAKNIEARVTAAGREGIVPELARVIMTGIEAADFYMVRLLSRQEMIVAVTQPIWDDHEIVQQPKPLRLFRFNTNAAWQPLRLPVSDQTKILDVVPVNAQRGVALGITEGEGLFRTTDAGESWENLNIGREVFLRAKQINIIVAPGPTVYALAILSTEPDADVNPLFLLRHRSWSDRWRLGLAKWLNSETLQ